MLLWLSFVGLAQDGSFQFGARNTAMGNTSLTDSDIYSLFNNIGALSGINETTVAAGYQLRYGLLELGTVAFAVAHPLNFGTVGISFFRFGGDLMNQQKASVGFSNQFGLVSLGANLSWLQYNFQEVGSRSALVIEFGGTAKLTDQLRFGAYVFNINQSELDRISEIQIPLVMRAGISFLPSDELIINLETIKRLNHDAQLRAGLEYFIIKNISARTGIETNPIKASAGIGFRFSRFQLDYGYANHSILNDIHDFSISMHL